MGGLRRHLDVRLFSTALNAVSVFLKAPFSMR
jgi:hypothetical protein